MTPAERRRVLTFADLISPERALIFRITHRDNVPHIVENGLHCRNSNCPNPAFVAIGNSEIIVRREAKLVEVEPFGSLADYVPFYFTPRTPMLQNIVTGWRGLRQYPRAEIVVLVSSLKRLEDHHIPFVIADRNAVLSTATLQNGRALLGNLPWDSWKASDYRHDSDKPDKIERYHAEALVYKHLPPSALAGIVTFDEATQARIAQAVTDAGLQFRVLRQPTWYP